jgi:hypothetical protein
MENNFVILSSDEEAGEPVEQLQMPPRNYATVGQQLRHRNEVRHQINLNEIYQQELTEYLLSVRSMIQSTRRRIRSLNTELTTLERQRARRLDGNLNRRRRVPVRNRNQIRRGHRAQANRRDLDVITTENAVTFRLNLFNFNYVEFVCNRSSHPGYLCCVCHEDYESLNGIRGIPLLTPCRHQVCRDCMESIIRLDCVRNSVDMACPLCRRILINAYN